MEVHPFGCKHFIAVTAHTQDRYLGARVRGSQVTILIQEISKMFEAEMPSLIGRQYLGIVFLNTWRLKVIFDFNTCRK